jgi:uncharacterized protein YcaQ
MHDLILRNRVTGYACDGLHRSLHNAGARGGFEHYLPETHILAALPFDSWPYLQRLMKERSANVDGYLGALNADQRPLAIRILDEIREKGPLGSDAFLHEGRSNTAWGTRGTAAKAVLEKLFAHGRVLISGRSGFRRVYDLAERIIPASVLAQPDASEREVARWCALRKLRQRRLTTLKRREVELAGDQIASLDVPGCPALYCLSDDLPLLDTVSSTGNDAAGPLLLAPLDPLIVDRRLTKLLWNFEYTWEVYVPAAKRVRGYYALPVLDGLTMVGHVEPRIDRRKRRLVLVSKSLKRGVRSASALKDLERFLS